MTVFSDQLKSSNGSLFLNYMNNHPLLYLVLIIIVIILIGYIAIRWYKHGQKDYNYHN